MSVSPPARYPDGFERGKPADYFDEADADGAISHTREIFLILCRSSGSTLIWCGNVWRGVLLPSPAILVSLKVVLFGSFAHVRAVPTGARSQWIKQSIRNGQMLPIVLDNFYQAAPTIPDI